MHIWLLKPHLQFVEAFVEKTAWETEPCLQNTASLLKGTGEIVMLWKSHLLSLIMMLEANFQLASDTEALWHFGFK